MIIKNISDFSDQEKKCTYRLLLKTTPQKVLSDLSDQVDHFIRNNGPENPHTSPTKAVIKKLSDLSDQVDRFLNNKTKNLFLLFQPGRSIFIMLQLSYFSNGPTWSFGQPSFSKDKKRTSPICRRFFRYFWNTDKVAA